MARLLIEVEEEHWSELEDALTQLQRAGGTAAEPGATVEDLAAHREALIRFAERAEELLAEVQVLGVPIDD